MQASPYPWDRLRAVPRGLVRTLGSLRPSLARIAPLGRIEQVLADVLSGDVVLTVDRVAASEPPPPNDAIVVLALEEGALQILVDPEPDLVNVALARVLQRPLPLSRPDAALDAALRGALTALVVESARRVSKRAVSVGAPPAATTPGIAADVTVVLDERAYRLRVWGTSTAMPTQASDDEAALGRLGATFIALPIVAARSLASRADLAALAPGDVWLPRGGWTARPIAKDAERRDWQFEGRLAIVAPSSERGLWIDGMPDGGRILSDAAATLPLDAESEAASEEPEDVVRVEVARVMLEARQWADLRAGDDLAQAIDWQARVTLRVAGAALARGELVLLDGEPGVRILE